ncbi:MAG TPA: phosphate ABC transporter permease PstA [Candidatus Thermoplasmatota archaeon]|nr:phosphate ABC transporter permease PstA [Candidatus Thermoplasmatota archaeon]
MDRRQRRRIVHWAATAACLALAAVAMFPLFSVLAIVVERGAPALSWAFLSGGPAPPMLPGGGIRHAIIGTGVVVGLGAAIGAPVGLLAGTYLAEVGRGRFASGLRTVVESMAGIPSIVAGLFAYALVVTRIGYSAWAGAVALAVIMVPIVTRTTEEALRTVPKSLRDGGLALGSPQWHTTLLLVFPSAAGAVGTGLLLSVARIAGETAPLLLTVLASSYVTTDPREPMATLPYLIYDYGKSAYPKLNEQAWGAALVLLTMILALNLVVRLVSRRRA